MLFLIPIYEIKKNCKEKLLYIYGWTGTITVVTAYAMISYGSEKYILIDILNLYGSLSLGIICYHAKVWQSLVCEMVWFSIGIYSFINNLFNEEKTSCH